MKSLFNIFKQFWFISLLIIIALSLGLYGLAPHLIFNGRAPLQSPVVQLIILTALTFIWGIINLIYAKLNKKGPTSNNSTQIDTTAKAPATNSDNPDQFYQQCFDSYLSFCKKQNIKWKKLPRFLLLGKTNSGKSLLASTSGLFIPALGNFHAASLGIHLLTNIWLSKTMTLFEVPLPENFHHDDTVLKEHFIAILKSAKTKFGKKTIDGILLAVSVTDFAESNKINCDNFAVNIKYLLASLTELAQANLPVNIVFTHGDQILGFNEFFANSEHSLQHAFGMQFNRSDDLRQKFEDYFSQLTANLKNDISTRLSLQMSPEQNALRMNFILQLASLKNNIANFLSTLALQTDYLLSYFIQGWYLVSNQQSGAPLDNFTGTIPIKGKLKGDILLPEAKMNQAYFVKATLQRPQFNKKLDPLFLNHSFENLLQQDHSIKLLLLGSSLIILASTFRWYQSYESQKTQFTTIQSYLTDATQQTNGMAKLMDLYSSSKILDTRNFWNSLIYLGLYRGDKLQPAIEDYYRSQLKTIFLPFLSEMLTAQFNQNNLSELYQSLKAYLMLGYPQFRDKQFLMQWFSNQWQVAYDDNAQAELKLQLQALLEEPHFTLPLNQPLIANLRTKLTTITPAQYQYWNLEQSAQQQDTSLNAGMSWDNSFREIFDLSNATQHIQWLYTKAGYQFYLKHTVHLPSKLNEDWVLNEKFSTDNNAENINGQIANLYALDYQRNWQEWINQLQLKKANTLAEAINQLNVLSSPVSPLTNLVNFINNNTHLTNSNLIEKQFNILTLFNQEPAAVTISHAFLPWQQLTLARNNQPTPLSMLQTSLNNLNIYLQNIANAENPDQACFNATKQLLAGNSKSVFSVLQQQIATLPQPMQAWMQQINQQAIALLFIGAKNYVNAQWQTQVFLPYQQNLSQRFPFANKAKQEVALGDFTHFFAPQGTWSTFMQTTIAPFYQNTRTWQPLLFLGQGLNLSWNSLQTMTQLNAISQTFFATNPTQPTFTFYIKPINLSSNMLQVELSTGDKNIIYRHDPQVLTQISWPAIQPDGLQFNFVDLNQQPHVLQIPGTWAWFRWIDTAKMTRQSATSASLTIGNKDENATYLLSSENTANPLFAHLFKGLNTLPFKLN